MGNLVSKTFVAIKETIKSVKRRFRSSILFQETVPARKMVNRERNSSANRPNLSKVPTHSVERVESVSIATETNFRRRISNTPNPLGIELTGGSVPGLEAGTSSRKVFYHTPNTFSIELSGGINQPETDTPSFGWVNHKQNHFADTDKASTSQDGEEAVFSPVNEIELIPMEIETTNPQTFFHTPNTFGIELSGGSNHQDTDISSLNGVNHKQNHFGGSDKALISHGGEEAVFSPVNEIELIPMEIETTNPQTLSHASNLFGIELSGGINPQGSDTSSFSRVNHKQNDSVDSEKASTSDGGEKLFAGMIEVEPIDVLFDEISEPDPKRICNENGRISGTVSSANTNLVNERSDEPNRDRQSFTNNPLVKRSSKRVKNSDANYKPPKSWNKGTIPQKRSRPQRAIRMP